LPVLLKFHRKSTFKLQGQKLDAYRKILDATRLQIPMALDFSDESTLDKLEQRWGIFSSILQHTPEFSFYTWAQQCRIQLFLKKEKIKRKRIYIYNLVDLYRWVPSN